MSMIKFDTREKQQRKQEIILRHMIDFIISKYTKRDARNIYFEYMYTFVI